MSAPDWRATARVCLLEMMPEIPPDDIELMLDQAQRVQHAAVDADDRESGFGVDGAAVYLRQMTLFDLCLRTLKRTLGLTDPPEFGAGT